MKVIRIEITTFVHATEGQNIVICCLKNLIPFEFAEETQRAYGHAKNPINLVYVNIKKNREIRTFIKNLQSNLTAELKRQILEEIEDRFLKGKFYLRLDKDALCAGVVTPGEGVQIVFTVTSFPYNEKKIKKGLIELFQG